MSPEYADIHIESTLPKPWEEEHSFNDILYDWMGRAPWLAISAAAHLLIFFIMQAIPWEQFRAKDAKELQAKLQQTPEEIFEEPEEEIIEEIEEEPIEEPILQDAEVVEDFEEAEGDPDFLDDSPFDADAFNDVIGIGGGAGGKFGGRFGGRKKLRAQGGAAAEQALKDALEWLKSHQSHDGSWDCDGFFENCGKIGSNVCADPGGATHDVGVTSLALLAFLGDANTTNEGPYRDVVSRGIKWLREQQDPDTGLIGDDISHDYIYDHSIATLAVCEAYYFSKSPLIKQVAQSGIDYIHRSRNPYGAWRYDVPPIGDNDTSVTGWMLFALASAKEAKLKVDEEAMVGGLAWIEEVSDPRTGRVGYDGPGQLSSRTPANERWPREKGEAMTAVGLLCRIFLGQDPDTTMLAGEKIMQRHADLLRQKPPAWDEEGFGCDMYYWYYGTYAMYQMGGNYWKAWNVAMKEAVIENQQREGDEKGSWDPVGPWGYSGGRVYSTALMTLCIEVYYRYARVLGAR